MSIYLFIFFKSIHKIVTLSQYFDPLVIEILRMTMIIVVIYSSVWDTFEDKILVFYFIKTHSIFGVPGLHGANAVHLAE